ncbi:sigma-54-dependent Fis family transcriptional regulator [Desulfosporosinus youngiae]|uniref:PAS domain S-box n=1 Tax=Desulfosporosinus youngiae DSM 17734 TaxID=768710 RepID=H5Y5Y8_9FIRM|nr:sigma-54-dependent Fis family transcriptional regulator [Desulfosporosinus youngiae]EHQ90927.1 PAS domain S-box [Desulfosporosinus youngiae DSM 17734]
MDHFSVDSMIALDFPKVSVEREISKVYEEFGHTSAYVYVVDKDGLLVGLLDQSAMIQAGTDENLQKPAGELMCKAPKCLASGSTLEEAVSYFSAHQITEVPVIDEAGRMIGLLKVWPLLDYQASKLKMIDSELNESKRLTATLEAVIENPYEGLVVVDENSRVIIINNFYLEAIGITREQALGRHIRELTPHSELPDIVRTGKAQFVDYWKVRDRDFMIIRAPIKRDGKTIGAMGKTLFKDMGLAHVFARKLAQMENDLKFYKEELRKIHSATYTFEDIVGEDIKMTSTIYLAKRVARASSTVLLTGESGTGKELFAHAIHNDGARRYSPFIKVNCAAIPEQLLESELFGYAEGAFTGACKGGKPGKFELANHGTIFLDEIGDMSLTMQAKLLRVIQEREIERVGGTQTFKIDVRIITATNRKLDIMVQEGMFREDLFYRLNVIVLELPCLRERPSDIRLLANYMLTKLKQKLETGVKGISQESMQLLQNYSWPGNVRELESVLEQVMNIVDEPFILPEHLPARIPHSKTAAEETQSMEKGRFEEGVKCAEKELLVDALKRSKGNKSQAAKILGIHRSVMYKKLRKHGLGGMTLSQEY